MVIATQNPTGAAGTQLLPDSQIDRFMIRLSLGYPAPGDEVTMLLQRQQGREPLKQVENVVDADGRNELRRQVSLTHMDDQIADYIARLVAATRTDDRILRGASPRATLSVAALSKAVAQLQGRDYVVPKDVQEAFLRAAEHRIQLIPGQDVPVVDILRQILKKNRAPKLR
jgi:MoxR-like ATPase